MFWYDSSSLVFITYYLLHLFDSIYIFLWDFFFFLKEFMWPAKDIQDTMKSKPKTCTNKKVATCYVEVPIIPHNYMGQDWKTAGRGTRRHHASNSKKTSTNQHSYVLKWFLPWGSTKWTMYGWWCTEACMAHLLVGESLPRPQGSPRSSSRFCVDSIWKQQSEWPERLSCGNLN